MGERWTLLLLRELFAGRKRFTDLAAGLPGAGTAVLSERLRRLERHGLIARRRVGPPTPAVLYELTPRGAALEPVLAGLARWGATYLDRRPDLPARGRWLLQAMAAAADAPSARIEPVNFVLDGEECHVLATHGRLAARDGLKSTAAATVRGTVNELRALATAGFEVEGNRALAGRLLDHLVAGFRQAARQ